MRTSSVSRRPSRAVIATLVLGVLAAGLSLVLAGPVASAGAAGDNGTQTARPGETVVLYRGATFTHGQAGTTFRLPKDQPRKLTLAVETRVADGSAYRTQLRFTDAGPKLLVKRLRNGTSTVLAKTIVNRPISDVVRIELRTYADRIQARAFKPALLKPAWQIDVVDPNPIITPGQSRATARLASSAPGPLSIGWLFTSLIDALDPILNPQPDPAPDPTPTPTPTPGCPLVGIYNDGNPDLDTDGVRQFGRLPEVASSYYQPTQRVNVAKETDRIQRGTIPNITITTKGTNRIEALGVGPTHPGFAAANAWLQQYVDDLAALVQANPGVPVYATVDHEYRVKVRIGDITGASADPANYGRTLQRFYDMVEATEPRIRTTYWMVGSDREFEAKPAQQFRTLPEAILFDPYGSTAGDTIASVAGGDVSWIRSQDWYNGQEIGLGEFGMRVSAGDAAMKKFFTDVRGQFERLGISWGVFFNRERDFDTRIIERTDGMKFPGAVSAFAFSLQLDCAE